TQMYTGAARWDEIAAVVQALDIPALDNGDSKTSLDAVRMYRETGCAGGMIARGSFGQPSIFDQTRDLLEGRPMRPDPSIEDRFATALAHARTEADYATYA